MRGALLRRRGIIAKQFGAPPPAGLDHDALISVVVATAPAIYLPLVNDWHLLDASGNARNMAWVNPATLNYDPTVVADVYEWDGVNDQAALAHAAWMNGATASWAAWVHPFNNEAHSVWAKWSSGGYTSRSFGFGVAAGVGAAVRTYSGDAERIHSAGIPVSGWVFAAITYGGGTLRIYHDGIEVANASLSGNLNSTTLALRMGTREGGTAPFAGRIIHAAYWPGKVLTAAEVTSMWTAAAAPWS